MLSRCFVEFLFVWVLLCAICYRKTFAEFLNCVYLIGKLLLEIVRHLVFG